MKIKTMVQWLTVPFLFIFIILVHELGHALVFMMCGVNQMRFEMIPPFSLALISSYGHISSINKIFMAMMGSILGGFASLLGLLFSRKYKMRLFMFGFYILLLLNVINLTIPIGDLYIIQKENHFISSIIQLVSIGLAVFVISMYFRFMLHVVNDYFETRNPLTGEMARFYELYDKIMEQS